MSLIKRNTLFSIFSTPPFSSYLAVKMKEKKLVFSAFLVLGYCNADKHKILSSTSYNIFLPLLFCVVNFLCFHFPKTKNTIANFLELFNSSFSFKNLLFKATTRISNFNFNILRFAKVVKQTTTKNQFHGKL